MPYPNYTTVQDLVATFYDGAVVTQIQETNYTVGTTVVTLGATGVGPRIQFTASNTGSTNIAIGFTQALTVAQGILLLPGGSVVYDWYYDGDILSRTIYAIGSAAAGTLYVLERILAGA